MEIKEFFKKYQSVAVAFSGGVDSAVLLCLAVKYAKRVKAYYVKSQFQPQFELDDALEIANMTGADLEVINFDILSDEKVKANPQNRCYYCKKRIFGAIRGAAEKDGFKIILDGTNFSDDLSDRPGVKALEEYGVLSPLRLCNLTKRDIRSIAEDFNLPVADKPSYACLATRIPYGVSIKKEYLETTEAAEAELKKLGLKNFRVRYLDKKALLQLGKGEQEIFSNKKDEIHAVLLKYYDGVYLDLKVRDDE